MPEAVPKKNLGVIDSYIRNQTPYLQGSIVHADQKATYLFAILVLLLSYLESRQSLIGRGVALGQWRGWETVATGISLAAAVLLVLSGCWAGRVVWPRYDRKATKLSASFVGVTDEFAAVEDFVKDLLGLDDEEVLKRQLRSHHYRCGVCREKWRLLKWAYGFSAAGFLLFVLHFVLAVTHELRWMPWN